MILTGFYQIFTFLIIGFIVGLAGGYTFKKHEDEETYDSYDTEIDALVDQINQQNNVIQFYKNLEQTDEKSNGGQG